MPVDGSIPESNPCEKYGLPQFRAQSEDNARRAYVFIKEYIERNGRSPYYREVSDALGLGTPAAANHYIDALVARGLIGKRPGKQRCLYLPEQCAPELDLAATEPRPSIRAMARDLVAEIVRRSVGVLK